MVAVFSKVVEMGSFTRAAEVLHMSQSAVSHAVAGLEIEFGVPLLIRDRKHGIVVTDLGRRVLEPMRVILNRVAQIEQEAADAQGLEAGTTRIGSFPSASRPGCSQKSSGYLRSNIPPSRWSSSRAPTRR